MDVVVYFPKIETVVVLDVWAMRMGRVVNLVPHANKGNNEDYAT